MTRLLLDLAEAECQVATLALAGGETREGTRCLTRASRYLKLRGELATRDATPAARPAIAER